VRADLPHTALQSVVLPSRGLTDQREGRGHAPDPNSAKDASFHPNFVGPPAWIPSYQSRGIESYVLDTFQTV